MSWPSSLASLWSWVILLLLTSLTTVMVGVVVRDLARLRPRDFAPAVIRRDPAHSRTLRAGAWILGFGMIIPFLVLGWTRGLAAANDATRGYEWIVLPAVWALCAFLAAGNAAAPGRLVPSAARAIHFRRALREHPRRFSVGFGLGLLVLLPLLPLDLVARAGVLPPTVRVVLLLAWPIAALGGCAVVFWDLQKYGLAAIHARVPIPERRRWSPMAHGWMAGVAVSMLAFLELGSTVLSHAR